MGKILAITVFVVLVTVCCASPHDRRKRGIFSPFAGGFAYTGTPYGSPFVATGLGAWSPFFSYPSFDFPRHYIPWPVITMPVNWYEGPNVCKTEKICKEPEEIKEWLSDESFGNTDFKHEEQSCRGSNTVYVCLSRQLDNDRLNLKITRYECCHGFVRPKDGSPGCVEIDLKDLLPTLRSMGAWKMVNIAETIGMAEDLHRKNYTLFCPLNTALENFQDQELVMDNEVLVKPKDHRLRKKSALYELMTKHMVPGFLKVDDFVVDQIAETEHPGVRIRMNVYYTPAKVATANCVPILSADRFARNGIIHVVEKVLPAPSRTVADVIAGDAQFSILKGMLSRAGLVQHLRNTSRTFTLFAPTDSAFSTLPSTRRYSESKSGCVVSAMKHHIVDHVICSSAIPHQARSLNAIGELLSLTRDKYNKIYVDGVQIVVRDRMATNGVVHVIDGVLSTRQAKTVSEMLEDSGLKEFLHLLKMANLTEAFDSMKNVTLFVPSDEAIKTFPPIHLESLSRNNRSLADVLLYHVVQGQTELNAAEQVLKSAVENATVRVQIYSPFPHSAPQMLAQCATVLSPNNKLCGGTLHVINRLLLPPKLTIVETLESMDGFSTLVLLLRVTGLERRLASPASQHTLLAPTDDAFHQMGQNAVFRLLENLEMATDLLRMHMLPGTMCCSRLKGDLLSGRRRVRAMDGSLLRLSRSQEGVLLVGGARIVDCDIMTSNGAVHMVDAIVRFDTGSEFTDNVFIRI